MLHDNGHFFGIAIAEPVRHFDVGVHGVKGYEEMMLTGQAVFSDIRQHRADEPPHRAVHKVSVVNAAVHAVS